MAFDIKIKPLVLFDLEDRIKREENEACGKGKQFYRNFLASLTELQRSEHHESPVYESVRKYTADNLSCSLFYMITGNTIFVMGLL